LRLQKPRNKQKKPFLCASHFFKSNLELQTLQAVGVSKIGRPLQKTRQNHMNKQKGNSLFGLKDTARHVEYSGDEYY